MMELTEVSHYRILESCAGGYGVLIKAKKEYELLKR
jgi:hypothetical protein